jgi:hypothetical protein
MIKSVWTAGAVAPFLFCALAFAGPSRFGWVREHAGPDQVADYGSELCVDAAGNVYVVGETQGQGTGIDFLVLKYDHRGHLIWSRTYDGEGGDDHGYLIKLDPLGNVIVAGDSAGTSSDVDIVVLKYSPIGALLWERRYNGPGNSYDGTGSGRTLAVDQLGNVVVCGTSIGAGTDYDAVTLKYSPAGTLLWERRFNGPASSFDDAYAIAIDAGGNSYVAADTYSAMSGSTDFVVLKYDPSGNLQWSRSYDGPDHADETIYAIALDMADNVYIAGISDSIDTGADFATVSWDVDGNFRWARRFDGGSGGWDAAFAIAVSAQGDVVTVGSGSDVHGFETAFAVSYDAGGGTRWVRSSQDPVAIGPNTFTDAAFDAHGNVFVTGWSWAGFAQSTNSITVEYATDGAVVWQRTYDGDAHGSDATFSIELDKNGTAYLAGVTLGTDLSPDSLTIKCGFEIVGAGNFGMR